MGDSNALILLMRRQAPLRTLLVLFKDVAMPLLVVQSELEQCKTRLRLGPSLQQGSHLFFIKLTWVDGLIVLDLLSSFLCPDGHSKLYKNASSALLSFFLCKEGSTQGSGPSSISNIHITSGQQTRNINQFLLSQALSYYSNQDHKMLFRQLLAPIKRSTFGSNSAVARSLQKRTFAEGPLPGQTPTEYNYGSTREPSFI